MLASLAVYVTLQRSADQSFDGSRMLRVTAYILDHGHLARGYQGSSYYGIGFSLLALPTLEMQRTFADPSGLTIVTLANMVVLAATAGIVVRICRVLGYWLAPSVLAALAFSTLTMAATYSSTMLSEPGVAFGTTLAVLGLLRWRHGTPHGPLLAGLGAGCAALFRSDSVLLVVLPVGIAALVMVPKSMLWRRSSLSLFLLPLFSVGVWILWYNDFVSGGPLNFGYPDDESSFSWWGLYRLLLSPGKGFFWYNPILLASLVGLLMLWRRDRAVSTLIVALCLARVAFYAGPAEMHGGLPSFGPRYLLPLCALLAVPLAASLDRIADLRPARRFEARAAIAFLSVCAAYVATLGVWERQTSFWNAIHRYPPGLSHAAEAALLNTRRKAAFNTWTGSPLAYASRTLDHTKPFPLQWWVGGPSVTGVLSAGFAFLLGALALVAAFRRPGRHAPNSRERSRC
jgi:4-amino-4-deoxy-L-arabinose transferase-like glycosyltransferase